MTPAEVQANLVGARGQETTDMLCIAFCWCNQHGAGDPDGDSGADAGKKVVKPVPFDPRIA